MTSLKTSLDPLVPVHETLASTFRLQYPEADGRGTIVAVFDTGIDPGADNLQFTSDGKPKLINIIDASGSGDVDMSLKVPLTTSKDGSIRTLTVSSTRTLTLNPNWPVAIDDTYRVGTLIAYDIFPKGLINRLKKKRREDFEKEQRKAMNNVQMALTKWNELNKHIEKEEEEMRKRKLQDKKDLEVAISILNDRMKEYTDAGPIYDCIVYNDGKNWVAAVDTTETGDFTSISLLKDYAIDHEYASFSDASQLNFCVNIYENGSILSVVCDAGSHGTHVAGIVSGVAPGAQLISVKIGDARLGSMETTHALCRAITIMMQHKPDVINMSYGEYGGGHNTGRVVQLCQEIVNDFNVTFVCSAGNNGPALGSVGCPGGTSTCLLGVGAYVSPEMMTVEYSMRDSQASEAGAYTWTSRGPTFDGDVGVDICAPGAAITSVPNWTLSKKQLMNGTSMAAPNAAACIALLISGLKPLGISTTPYSIRRALQTTALNLPHVDKMAQGHGLIQVIGAFKHLKEQKNEWSGTKEFPLFYEISARGGNSMPENKGRGILLTQAIDFQCDTVEFTVNITPKFHKLVTPKSQVDFEKHFKLVASDPRWIETGKNLVLLGSSNGRDIKVLIRTTHLEAGKAHYGSIKAIDVQHPGRGSMFDIPVTILKPESLKTNHLQIATAQNLCPGAMIRRFITAPEGAAWADVTVSRESDENCESNQSLKLYYLHMMQFLPFTRQKNSEVKKPVTIGPGESKIISMDVDGGRTMELCFAQFWSSLGNSSVSLHIEFHGIQMKPSALTVYGGVGSTPIHVSSTLSQEALAPSIQYTQWVERIRPFSSDISLATTADGGSIAPRAQLPDDRECYQLILSYNITVSIKDTSEKSLQLTPVFPYLYNRLYESPFQSQLSLLFEKKSNTYIGCSDAYADSIDIPKGISGEFILRTMVQHEDVSKLEALKDMILFLYRKLPSDISASVYTGVDDVALGNKGISKPITLPVSTATKTLFVGEPIRDKLPTGVKPGDMLSGKIWLGNAKRQNGTGTGRRPNGFAIKYVIPPSPSKKKDEDKEIDEKDSQVDDNEAIRDLLLQRLEKLIGKSTFTDLYDRIFADYPANLKLLQCKVHHEDILEPRNDQLDKILSACDHVINEINMDELAQFYGKRIDTFSKKTIKEKDMEKNILIDTLARKTRVLGEKNPIPTNSNTFEVHFKELQQWVDVELDTRIPVVDCYISYHRQQLYHHEQDQPHYGLILQRLRSLQVKNKEKSIKDFNREKYAKEIQDIMIAMNWLHWVEYDSKQERKENQVTYHPF